MDALKTGLILTQLLAGLQVFALVAEPDTPYPFVLFRRSSVDPATTKDQFDYRERVAVELRIVSDRYDQSLTMAAEVANRLNNFSGNVAGVDVGEIRCQCGGEDFISNAYVQKLTIQIDLL